MKRIVLHVDLLVLRGIDRADLAAVSSALETALKARLADDRAVAALAAHDGHAAVYAGQAKVSPSGSPGALGSAVAARIALRAGR